MVAAQVRPIDRVEESQLGAVALETSTSIRIRYGPPGKPILGLDLDGVCCDFTSAWTKLADHLLPRAIQRHGPGGQLSYRGLRADMTKAEVDTLWQHIDLSSDFWRDLECILSGADHRALARACEENARIIFMTSRHGGTAREQTWEWLRKWELTQYMDGGMEDLYLDDHKVSLLHELNVVGFLDDRPSLVEKMHSSGVRVYVRDWPYNRTQEIAHVPRVSSVEEFVFCAQSGGRLAE